MPLRRALFALLLCGSAAWAADVNTLKMGVVSGESVAIMEKEVVVTKGGKKTTIPIDEVVQIDFAPAGKPKPDVKYSDVELTDGTILHCTSFLVKKDQAIFTPLTTGQEITVPLTKISNVLMDAQVAANRRDWDQRIAKKRLKDVYVNLKGGDTFIVVEGTFTEGDETGKTIKFTYTLADQTETKDVALASTYGIIFARGVDPNAKPVACKMTDAQGNLLYVSAVVSTPTGIEVTTSCGIKIAYPTTTVAKLDYTTGKVAYLSELKPSNLVETSPFDTVEHYQINRNLDGGPLKLEGKVYPNGLAVHAYTELEYDLKGEFREFKALVGVDDVVGGHDGPMPIKILGDGKELASFVVQRKDRGKAPKNLSINIKDVQKLKIIVGTGDLQDIGKHVNLADAKVTK